MRYIFSLVVIFALAIFMACQTATSSTAEADTAETVKKIESKTGNYKPEEPAKTTADSKGDDDEHANEDNVKRITLADAKSAFDSGEAFFIDTRSQNSYVNEHIKGAVNIPVGDLEKRYKEVPKNKKIITYCS